MTGAPVTPSRTAAADGQLRRLMSKHQEYEKRLEQLQSRKYLTDEEKLEEVRLKKLKLAVKDQMEQMRQRLPIE